MLDVSLLLATVLFAVALVLAAFGIALLICGLAVDLVMTRLLFCVLLRVPAFASLVRLIGGQGNARQGEQSCRKQSAGDPPPTCVFRVDHLPAPIRQLRSLSPQSFTALDRDFLAVRDLRAMCIVAVTANIGTVALRGEDGPGGLPDLLVAYDRNGADTGTGRRAALGLSPLRSQGGPMRPAKRRHDGRQYSTSSACASMRRRSDGTSLARWKPQFAPSDVRRRSVVRVETRRRKRGP